MMRLRARRRSAVGHCASAAASVEKAVKGVSLPEKDLCQIHHGRRLPFQLRQLNGIGSSLLLQLPPFRFGPQAQQWLVGLGRELSGLGPAVEFRHRSWARPEILDWLSEHGLGLVAV